jgi:hypothetical protein
MTDHLTKFQFQKGMEKIGGRKPGVRNRLSHVFLEQLKIEWERSGEAALKIAAVESPVEFCKLVAALLPKQHEVEAPSLIVVATGVPRAGEYYDSKGAPQVPAAAPLPVLPAAEGDDV